MIKYECDMCGTVLSKESVHIFEYFPRRIRTYAEDIYGVKLASFEDNGFAETHLCNGCCNKIAILLPVAE